MTATDAPMASSHPVSLPWIERLIRHKTTSRDSNLGLIEEVRDHLAGAGLHTRLTYDAAGGKANLFATVAAADGDTRRGLVLSGHTDVVPTDGQDWSSDPFQPEVREGRLYGRGSADMKGFIGVALTRLPQMRAAPLRAPIHFALSFDEEIGCVGAPLMLADLEAHGIAPESCIVGEPTSMEVVTAHKGINIYRCRVHGRAAHSSLTPKGVNAIEYAARLICFIRDLADRARKDGPFDAAYDVPFTTGQTGTISGGTASNIVPALCEFAFEFRNLPGDDPRALYDAVREFAQAQVAEMKAVSGEAAIEFETLATAPALEGSEAAEITRLVRALTRDQAVRKVAYGTEGGLFQAAGVPAVICGPGSIEQAHRAEEYVALEQLVRCEVFLDQVIARMQAP